jgi:hypothetical protein
MSMVACPARQRFAERKGYKRYKGLSFFSPIKRYAGTERERGKKAAF